MSVSPSTDGHTALPIDESTSKELLRLQNSELSDMVHHNCEDLKIDSQYSHPINLKIESVLEVLARNGYLFDVDQELKGKRFTEIDYNKNLKIIPVKRIPYAESRDTNKRRIIGTLALAFGINSRLIPRLIYPHIYGNQPGLIVPFKFHLKNGCLADIFYAFGNKLLTRVGDIIWNGRFGEIENTRYGYRTIYRKEYQLTENDPDINVMVKYRQGMEIEPNVTIDGLSVEINLNKNPDKFEELQKLMIATPSLAKNSPENILYNNSLKFLDYLSLIHCVKDNLFYIIGIHSMYRYRNNSMKKYCFRITAYKAPDKI